MDPVVWGNPMWKSIHYIALGYPDKATQIDKTAYYSYFTNLYKVIPCQSCADHLRMLVLQNPITTEVLKSNRSLFNWTVNIHNEVNKKLNKPILSNDAAFALYDNKRVVSESVQTVQSQQTQRNQQDEKTAVKKQKSINTNPLKSKWVIVSLTTALFIAFCLFILLFYFIHGCKHRR